MGVAFKPVFEFNLSPAMQKLLEELIALKNDPNAKRVNMADFNFKQSQEELADIKESFADLVWEEREERG